MLKPQHMEFIPTMKIDQTLFFCFVSPGKEVCSREMLCSISGWIVASSGQQWPPDHGSLSQPSESVRLRISGAEYWNFIAGRTVGGLLVFALVIVYHCYGVYHNDKENKMLCWDICRSQLSGGTEKLCCNIYLVMLVLVFNNDLYADIISDNVGPKPAWCGLSHIWYNI